MLTLKLLTKKQARTLRRVLTSDDALADLSKDERRQLHRKKVIKELDRLVEQPAGEGPPKRKESIINPPND